MVVGGGGGVVGAGVAGGVAVGAPGVVGGAAGGVVVVTIGERGELLPVSSLERPALAWGCRRGATGRRGRPAGELAVPVPAVRPPRRQRTSRGP